jgi:predicted nucleic-acid-binding Zn-ribbon protein
MDIRDGICPKCQAATIRAQTLALGRTQGASSYDPAHYVRVFVCVTCGYTELYARTSELSHIARSREWDVVPVTGETTRLNP